MSDNSTWLALNACRDKLTSAQLELGAAQGGIERLRAQFAAERERAERAAQLLRRCLAILRDEDGELADDSLPARIEDWLRAALQKGGE